MAKMNLPMANRAVKHYRCAGCWGTLVKQLTEQRGVYEVVCRNENCNHAGFHSQHYIDNQRLLDLDMSFNARRNLKSILPEREAKTESDLIKELGF